MAITRGEVYYVSLDPIKGQEMGYKMRQFAVVSINDLNKGLVIVVPGTSQEGSKRPDKQNVVKVPITQQNKLDSDTFFHCHQVRAIDKSCFITPAVGRLSTTDLNSLEHALIYSLGLPPMARIP
jgi:mRNA-degrading endonuclease toxin of MazEF toxin-antitoxin module